MKLKAVLKGAIKLVLFFGVLAFLVIGGELKYAQRIAPTGVVDVAGHFARFGPPRFIYKIRQGDKVFFSLNGFPREGPPVFALPSSPPAYIYDQNGRFVEWCSDPGDRCPGWFAKWPIKERVSVEEFRRELSLR